MKLDDDFYTVSELAALLKIGKTHAYSLVKRGDIKAISIGERIKRIPKSAIVDYVAMVSKEGKT